METPSYNLQDAIDHAGGAIPLLRNSQIGPFVFPVLPFEYTNWRAEQRSWKESCAFIDMSYHQTNLYLRGPDARDLLHQVALNRFGEFPVGAAKQLIACSPGGNMIADGICFHLEPDLYRVCGASLISNWVQYHAETGGYRIEVKRDETVYVRPGDPKIYIYQIQEPNALDLMRAVTGGQLPDIKFFRIGAFDIGGIRVRALRHGMAGQAGFELFGPWSEGAAVRAILEKAGREFGMRKVGAGAIGTTAIESAWLPIPLPDIYDAPETQAYRNWLPALSIEGGGSLGGSFRSSRLADYYVDPVEAGYGRLIDMDRSFIGSEALRGKMETPGRRKVTLVWDEKDVAEILRSSLFDREGARYLNLPLALYNTFQYDTVLEHGRHVGVSQHCGFSANARSFLSLALVDGAQSEPGTALTLRWGDLDSPRGRSPIKEVRVIVAPAPIFEKVIKGH